jgi:hypothetical protein
MACVPQLHGEGRCRFRSHNASEISSFLALERSALVWARGPPQRRQSIIIWFLHGAR